MNKNLKVILYCILAIILIIVVFVMLGLGKHKAGEPDVNTEVLTGDEVEIEEEEPTFEQDVMNDLESYFNTNNGYEDIQGEFGFIDSENS